MIVNDVRFSCFFERLSNIKRARSCYRIVCCFQCGTLVVFVRNIYSRYRTVCMCMPMLRYLRALVMWHRQMYIFLCGVFCFVLLVFGWPVGRWQSRCNSNRYNNNIGVLFITLLLFFLKILLQASITNELKQEPLVASFLEYLKSGVRIFCWHYAMHNSLLHSSCAQSDALMI